jgi:hypothetical protein
MNNRVILLGAVAYLDDDGHRDGVLLLEVQCADGYACEATFDVEFEPLDD